MRAGSKEAPPPPLSLRARKGARRRHRGRSPRACKKREGNGPKKTSSRSLAPLRKKKMHRERERRECPGQKTGPAPRRRQFSALRAARRAINNPTRAREVRAVCCSLWNNWRHERVWVSAHTPPPPRAEREKALSMRKNAEGDALGTLASVLFYPFYSRYAPFANIAACCVACVVEKIDATLFIDFPFFFHRVYNSNPNGREGISD